MGRVASRKKAVALDLEFTVNQACSVERTRGPARPGRRVQSRGLGSSPQGAPRHIQILRPGRTFEAWEPLLTILMPAAPGDFCVVGQVGVGRAQALAYVCGN